jgi:hypothetical protein
MPLMRDAERRFCPGCTRRADYAIRNNRFIGAGAGSMGGLAFARRLGTSCRIAVRSGVLFQRFIDASDIEPASANRRTMSVALAGSSSNGPV